MGVVETGKDADGVGESFEEEKIMNVITLFSFHSLFHALF